MMEKASRNWLENGEGEQVNRTERKHCIVMVLIQIRKERDYHSKVAIAT